jgi:FkbM family methyltransferase
MLIKYKLCKQIIESIHQILLENVYHIGAHLGEEVDDYAQNGVNQIIWFEANSDLVPALHSNIDRYSINQAIVPCALWDSNSVIPFNITNNNQSSSLFEMNEHLKFYPAIQVSEVKDVEVFRLDYLIDHPAKLIPWSDVQFINIDTQGAELAILKGLGSYIESPTLKGIFLEVNNRELYKDIPLIKEIDEFLSAYQFQRVVTKWWGDHGWGDALYVKTIEGHYVE